MPSPPAPNTATVSPGCSRALRSAWNDVDDEHIMIAPTSNGISSGSGHDATLGHGDVLRVPAVAVLAQHLARVAELLLPAVAAGHCPHVTR